MPRIIFLTAYPVADASCRFRIYQFIPHLEAAGYKCTVAPFMTDRLFQILKSPEHLTRKMLETLYCGVRRLVRLLHLSTFDLVVIHREAFPFFAPLAETWVLRRGKNVIFSFDDAIYTGHEDISRLPLPLLYRWKYGRGYDAIIRDSALVIAGNRILAEYARRLNNNVTVIPTVVDCQHYKFRPRSDTPRRITIGWMGSQSTVRYLDIAMPALKRISERYGDYVRFRFVGCPQYQPELPGSESLPFSLTRELDDLYQFDIGLMPLADSEWTRGKCAFKAIQYMATGAATVASPVGVTPDLIQHEYNGLLASTPEEWFQALDRLIQNAALRQALASNARHRIERSYSLEVWAPRFLSIISSISPIPQLQPEGAAA